MQSKYVLSPGLSGVTWNASITIDSLADLGKQIKATIPSDELKNFGTDLVEGFCNLNLDEDEIIKLLETNTYLQNDFLLAIGKTEWDSLPWGESSIAEKKDIINKVNLVFISSNNIAAYNKAKEKLVEQKVNHNLLDCSDAHYNIGSSEKDRIGKCFTWIKADTTFEGLRQVLYEFKDRVFVGDVPPSKKKLDLNPTRYIKKIEIKKIDSSMKEIWFDAMPSIELNSKLVAIIGNKGNGKSAITDIIGLIGNSHNYDDFSFLRPTKFLKKKPYDRASAYTACMEWYSGYKTEPVSLSSSVDYGLSEKVKYLPQNFLENICSEDIDNVSFEKELKNVIFSHLDESDRLGQTN